MARWPGADIHKKLQLEKIMSDFPAKPSFPRFGWSDIMRQSNPRLVEDLIEVAGRFPGNLRKVRETALDRPDLFVSGTYRSAERPGGGCLLWHLSDGEIESKAELSLFFTGKVGATDEESYIAARDLVRAWDHHWSVCDYGDTKEICLELIIDVLEYVIAGSEIGSPPSGGEVPSLNQSAT